LATAACKLQRDSFRRERDSLQKNLDYLQKSWERERQAVSNAETRLLKDLQIAETEIAVLNRLLLSRALIEKAETIFSRPFLDQEYKIGKSMVPFKNLPRAEKWTVILGNTPHLLSEFDSCWKAIGGTTEVTTKASKKYGVEISKAYKHFSDDIHSYGGVRGRREVYLELDPGQSHGAGFAACLLTKLAQTLSYKVKYIPVDKDELEKEEE
ncbi:hypothetical protein HK102_005201, partial [Quaeritorhiza haematococci]